MQPRGAKNVSGNGVPERYQRKSLGMSIILSAAFTGAVMALAENSSWAETARPRGNGNDNNEHTHEKNERTAGEWRADSGVWGVETGERSVETFIDDHALPVQKLKDRAVDGKRDSVRLRPKVTPCPLQVLLSRLLRYGDAQIPVVGVLIVLTCFL